jgi:hypothetical protein
MNSNYKLNLLNINNINNLSYMSPIYLNKNIQLPYNEPKKKMINFFQKN